MRGKRLKVTLRLLTMRSSFKRAQYLKEHNIFRHIGENCSIMNWALPLYPQLIKLGDNVHIASNVGFVTHDIAHLMLNHSELAKSVGGGKRFQEKLGCIEIGSNVFVGSGTRILYNVKIGSNVVIGSGSVVNRDIPDNSVAAGIPARVIGSFEDFVAKRCNDLPYPLNFAPSREQICESLASTLWNEFEKSRL